MERSLKIFNSPSELAEKLAEELHLRINKSIAKKVPFSVVLSGGSTPELLFEVLGSNYSKAKNWNWVHFFWGDERCVPPDDPESNYGEAKKIFFAKADIPEHNIHRIIGEADPEEEAARYSHEISSFTGKRNGWPLFDLVMLGLGEDGHTASIFPGNSELLNSDKICEVAIHPLTLQKRITLTGKVINNADSVVFLVTGRRKAKVVNEIMKEKPSSMNYPATYIVPAYGELIWFVDSEAASLI